MNPILTIVIIALIIIGLTSVIISTYNKIVMLKFNVDKAFANIDVILKQRADEIPNLIKVVKKYMNYEQNVLDQLTQLRTKFLNTTDMNEKIELSNAIDKNIKSVFAVSENYPDLKASNNFMALQGRVSDLENAIADRREFFNESVNMYNIGITEFPNVILAKILGYKEKMLLQISEEEKRYDGIQF